MKIIHSVLFRLKHKKSSAEEQQFLTDAAAALAPIAPQFKIYNEVSPKNNFDYYFYMVFSSQDEYDTYNSQPAHQNFVKTRWIPEVEDFMEVDLTEFDQKINKL
ncbi:MAG: Dabb family protein [Eubacteriales bacterium]